MTPEEFKTRRESFGLSMAGLAKLWGVDRGTVWRMERGILPVKRIYIMAFEAMERE